MSFTDLGANTPIYFDNVQKLNCILSAMNLVKLLTAESQSNIKVYNLQLINNSFYYIL